VTTSEMTGEDRAGSNLHGFDTASADPDELRAQLADARDRLSFYEGFDRVIAEHVRRSGELMLEMLEMREAMTASAERGSRQERERLAAGLAELESGLQEIRAQVDSLEGQVVTLRRALGTGAPQPSAPPPAPPPGPSAPVAPSPAPDVAPADSPVADWSAPQVIDVIAHQVTKATLALSLQRYLGGLESVSGVEAREFAEGVLRMQVTARRPLTAGDLAGWSDGGRVTVLQLRPTMVELSLDTAS